MTSGPKQKDLIGYEALQQEALRSIIRTVLKRVAAKGLPGGHHFFISFKTRAPGVSMPRDLLEQYPDEMMIVLQHQFWDLAPGETYFSVTLSFGRQPKTLSIPYAAVTQFVDPQAEFRLAFAVAPSPAAPTALPTAAASPQPAADEPEASAEPTGEKIVSLDQFRKK